MKLWHLLPTKDLPEDDDPWTPWYDKCFGMIIRAESEIEAREIADKEAACENGWGSKKSNPWLSERYSICAELRAKGEAGVVIQDNHAT